jgi:hypothetical protein
VTAPAVRPVAVVVTDDLDAVRAVRYTARLALAARRPLLLIVPLPGAGRSLGGSHCEVDRRRAEREADAVLGRVTAVLDRQDIPVATCVVIYPPRPTRTPGLSAVQRAARRADAAVLVTGPRWAGRGRARGVVLLDPVSGRTSSGQLVPEPRTGDGAAQPGELALGDAGRRLPGGCRSRR